LKHFTIGFFRGVVVESRSGAVCTGRKIEGGFQGVISGIRF